MLGFAGVIAMDERLAAVTVSVALAETAPDAAPMVEVPTDTPWARPVAPMVATAGLEEDQVTEELTSCEEPSEKAPIAVTC